MPLLDLSHTSHTRARTGVQRVARSLAGALGERAAPISFDPYRGAWRLLERWERANLREPKASAKRGARWPWSARLRGALRRLGAPREAVVLLPPGAGKDGLIVPEIFSAAAGAALPALLRQVGGTRIALFHDAIALRLPELSPPKTVARFPSYLQELLAFDGIAAISQDSRDSLSEYWRWLGAASPPPIAALPLGTDAAAGAASSAPPAADGLPIILSVGSIEGRKNHLALLEAAELLWSRGLSFELHLVGLGQPQTGAAALGRIEALRSAGRPLRYDGPVGERQLDEAYRRCAFTVYPSLMEGFGLPVLESLGHGRPCICSGRGALGEAAGGGGCLALDSVDAASLAGAMERLLLHPAERGRLAAEARARPLRSWREYAEELLSWMSGLGRR